VHTKAQFRSLAEPWADTGTSTGRLLGGLADANKGKEFSRKSLDFCNNASASAETPLKKSNQ
jgi:hypothetical protein